MCSHCQVNRYWAKNHQSRSSLLSDTISCRLLHSNGYMIHHVQGRRKIFCKVDRRFQGLWIDIHPSLNTLLHLYSEWRHIPELCNALTLLCGGVAFRRHSAVKYSILRTYVFPARIFLTQSVRSDKLDSKLTRKS